MILVRGMQEWGLPEGPDCSWQQVHSKSAAALGIGCNASHACALKLVRAFVRVVCGQDEGSVFVHCGLILPHPLVCHTFATPLLAFIPGACSLSWCSSPLLCVAAVVTPLRLYHLPARSWKPF